ncbi:MAG: prepilin-type N-terminal cleavage/methylation domain-containing protein [Verrucomicrobiota bacterium]
MRNRETVREQQYAGHCGFTLVELLTVITVIGILLLIAVPVVQSVSASQKQAQCLVNLRELGFAFRRYADDHSGMYPPGWKDRKGWATWLIEGDYVDVDTSRVDTIFTCPEHGSPFPGGTDRWPANNYSMHHRLGRESHQWGGTHPMRLNQLSNLILLGDGFQIEGNFRRANATFSDPSPFYSPNFNGDLQAAIPVNETRGGISYRHRGSANMLFVDGHVESMRKGSILYKNIVID